MSNLVAHAERELNLAGYTIDISDPMELEIYHSTMSIVRSFAAVGHSGSSAFVHTDMIHRLLQFKSLTELTADPGEWMEIEEGFGMVGTSQSLRRPDCFSDDGLKTYYSVDEFRTGWKRRLFGHIGKRYPLKPVGVEVS